jgi:hypothetical protein
VRLLGRWVLQADSSAVEYVALWDIMPVRARGARNQLQLNKGHYIGWCSCSCSNCQILAFSWLTRLGGSLVWVAHSFGWLTRM